MNNILRNFLSVIVFVLSVSAVIIGQRETGWSNLGIQFLGMFGILLLLYLYNRRFK